MAILWRVLTIWQCRRFVFLSHEKTHKQYLTFIYFVIKTLSFLHIYKLVDVTIF